MSRVVNLMSGLVLCAILLVLWIVPVSQRSELMTSAGLVGTGTCVVALSITLRHWLGTWRTLCMLLIVQIGAQAWLQWQWGLWNSPIVLIRNLNVVAGLIVFATFLALFASWSWLLVYRDASPTALALAWIGWQLLLIITALRYHTLDGMDSAGIREQIVLIVPVCLFSFLALAGGLGFLAHYIWLLVKEIGRIETLDVEHN